MDLAQTIIDFMAKYFVNPITNYEGYNPVNTITYGAIMFLLAFFVIYPKLNKRGIKFDYRFMLSLFPYILFATGIRVLEDTGIFARASLPWEAGYYLVSPGIWIATAILVLASLTASMEIAKRIKKPLLEFTQDTCPTSGGTVHILSNTVKKNGDFQKIFGLIGLAMCLPVLAYDILLFQRWLAFAEVLAFAAIAVIAARTILLFAGKNLFKGKGIEGILGDRMNLLAVSSQALDASATIIATSFYGYGEQHFTSNFILGINPLLFMVVKILLTIIILYYTEKEIKNENLGGFVKIVVIILGAATGTRDILTLGIGSNI